MILHDLLLPLAQGQALSPMEMTAAMNLIMDGQANPIELAAFLTALHCNGETVPELIAAAQVMNDRAQPLPWTGNPNAIDIVGTGGDGMQTFNISTLCAVVCAAAGAIVVKHGNRAASSRSGSADILEAAGVNLQLSPQQLVACIEQTGLGFLYAPLHHPAMQHVTQIRKQLGFRTLFNLLGPLTNPAGISRQVIGVYHSRWLRPFAEVCQALGSQHSLIVHAEDGMDEASIGAITHIVELKDQQLHTYIIRPEEFGLNTQDTEALKITDPQHGLAIFQQVLNNQPGPARDITLLNAGLGLYVSGQVKDIAAGIVAADHALASGKAKEKFQQFIDFTRRYR